MYESFNARGNLNERTIVGDHHYFSLYLITYLKFFVEGIPWMRCQLFQSEGNTFLLIIKVEDNHLDLLIECYDLFRMVDPAP